MKIVKIDKNDDSALLVLQYCKRICIVLQYM